VCDLQGWTWLLRWKFGHRKSNNELRTLKTYRGQPLCSVAMTDFVDASHDVAKKKTRKIYLTLGVNEADGGQQEEEQRGLKECTHLEVLLEINPLLRSLGEELTEASALYSPYSKHLLNMNALGRALIIPRARKPKGWRHDDGDVPLTLWPHILARATAGHDDGTIPQNKTSSCARRLANVIYHLLRVHFCLGPSLFEL
jgi:hypothetical protein